jgi:hypothetical protein
LTEKYARNATEGNQLLSATDAGKYSVLNAVFLTYGVTAAAMQIRKLSVKPAIMILTPILGELDKF